MQLPIPEYLRPFFRPTGENNSELEVTGTVQCDCGRRRFKVWESNDRQIVKLVCPHCGKEITAFDSGKYGWDGFVGGCDFVDRSRPFERYDCPQCRGSLFCVTIHIMSQGKQDFLDECVAYDDYFSPEDWVNAFEWIDISLRCENCRHKEKEWLDMETM